MDPNETLRRIRELLSLASVTRYKEDHFDYLLEVAGRFQDLDDWIQAGGFLPEDWQEVS